MKSLVKAVVGLFLLGTTPALAQSTASQTTPHTTNGVVTKIGPVINTSPTARTIIPLDEPIITTMTARFFIQTTKI